MNEQLLLVPIDTRTDGLRWLEKRVGSSGDGWWHILTQLRRELPTDRRAAGYLPPIDDKALGTLGASHQFRELSLQFPSRGSVARLVRIADVGAQLADIAWSTSPSEDRQALLVEGALFNVAVALFDTIVDDQPRRLGAAARCLSPDRLHRHLVGGDRLPTSSDPGVELVVSLFRFVIDSIRARVTDTNRREQLAAILSEMYRSETRRTNNAMAAKILPTVFFGELLANRTRKARVLFAKLSTFVALLDDWQDLAKDLVASSPNEFLGGAGARASVRSMGLVLYRVLGSRRSYAQIVKVLSIELHDAVDSAYAIGGPTNEKVLAFIEDLLGVRRDP